MPSHSNNVRAAALLGAACGLRTFTPPATLAARGRLPISDAQRKLLISAAIGELITDKLPFTPARTTPLPYLGRVTAGAVCGGVVAGGTGALAGAGAAATATLVGYQSRRLASKRISGTLVALLEDAVAIGVANLAVRTSD